MSVNIDYHCNVRPASTAWQEKVTTVSMSQEDYRTKTIKTRPPKEDHLRSEKDLSRKLNFPDRFGTAILGLSLWEKSA